MVVLNMQLQTGSGLRPTLMPILKVEDLSVSRSGKQVIHGINLEVFKGEFIGLVGPNGSGKHT